MMKVLLKHPSSSKKKNVFPDIVCSPTFQPPEGSAFFILNWCTHHSGTRFPLPPTPEIQMRLAKTHPICHREALHPFPVLQILEMRRYHSQPIPSSSESHSSPETTESVAQLTLCSALY